MYFDKKADILCQPFFVYESAGEKASVENIQLYQSGTCTKKVDEQGAIQISNQSSIIYFCRPSLSISE